MTLAEFKTSRDMTLAELAEFLGMPMSTVNGYLKGVRRPEAEQIRIVMSKTDGAVGLVDLRPDLADLLPPLALCALPY